MFCTKNSIVLVFASTLLLGGCATPKAAETTTDSTVEVSKKHSGCKFIQRNLTVGWHQRTYWCVPNK